MSRIRMTRNRFSELSKAVQDKCDALTELYAAQIESSAAAAAPVEYGILRASIQVQDTRVGARIAQRKIRVGANYGLFQHEGTKRGIKPNPYLKDAVDFWREDYLTAIGLAVKQ